MTTEKIKEFPDLIKKDHAVILNVDNSSYRAAIKRKQLEREKLDLISRVDALEKTLHQLVEKFSIQL